MRLKKGDAGEMLLYGGLAGILLILLAVLLHFGPLSGLVPLTITLLILNAMVVLGAEIIWRRRRK